MHLVMLIAFVLGIGPQSDPASATELSRTNLLSYEQHGLIVPVRSTNDWLLRRDEIVRAMTGVMGPFPGRSRAEAPVLTVVSETDCGAFVRREITYASDPGSSVPAYLLIPKSAFGGGKATPAMLTLHQTHPLGNKVVAGLGNSPDDEYGVELARRGYVCLAPAYPLLANYAPNLKQLGYSSGTMKAIWDNVRGLDLLESLPFVKRGAFGVIGHSLGGHNGLYTAVFDPRIRIIVSSCGFDSFRDYMGGNLTVWTSERYMPRLKNYHPDAVPFDFAEVLAALAPRAIFINAPRHDSNFQWESVDRVVAAARPVFALYGRAANLKVEHPDCAHRFPPAIRAEAYALIDREFKNGAK